MGCEKCIEYVSVKQVAADLKIFASVLIWLLCGFMRILRRALSFLEFLGDFVEFSCTKKRKYDILKPPLTNCHDNKRKIFSL